MLLIIPINSFEENNFKKRYGVFNWMKISIINTYDQYMDLMNLCPRSGEETYSTLVCVDEIIWLPTSCKWVMYGSRDYDLCMLATQESMPKYIALNPVEWVIKEGMVNAFRHQIIPENIVKSIIKNYSNK